MSKTKKKPTWPRNHPAPLCKASPPRPPLHTHTQSTAPLATTRDTHAPTQHLPLSSCPPRNSRRIIIADQRRWRGIEQPRDRIHPLLPFCSLPAYKTTTRWGWEGRGAGPPRPANPITHIRQPFPRERDEEADLWYTIFVLASEPPAGGVPPSNGLARNTSNHFDARGLNPASKSPSKTLHSGSHISNA